jgi:pyruvate kinase
MLPHYKSCSGEICYFPCPLRQIKVNFKKRSGQNVDYENTKTIKYDCKLNDLILLNCGTLQRKLVSKHDGPYQIIRVNSNGILRICKGIYVHNEKPSNN